MKDYMSDGVYFEFDGFSVKSYTYGLDNLGSPSLMLQVFPADWLSL